MVDALLGEGHHVIGVDNLLTGNYRNFAHLANDPRFDFAEQDITHTFDPGKVDLIFNMASPASPADYATYGIETLMVGSLGVRNVLEIAKKYGARLLHCSTSEFRL
jgi:dTDP-glucose 4,6-dehydratase